MIAIESPELSVCFAAGTASVSALDRKVIVINFVDVYAWNKWRVRAR